MFRKAIHIVPLVVALLLGSLAPCPLQAGDIGYLLWTVDYPPELWRSGLDGSGVERVVATGDIVALATDLVNNKLYWFVTRRSDPGELWRCNLDGSERELLLAIPDLDIVRDMALDVASSKLYWTEYLNSGANSIRRANLDGSGAETLVSGSFKGIALDLTALPEPRMYFNTSTAVKSARLDGSDLIDAVTGRTMLNRVAVDGANDKLYFSSASSTFAMVRSDLDGQNLEILVTSSASYITVEGSSVYFAETATGDLRIMNLDGSGQQLYLSASQKIMDFSLDFVNGHAYFQNFTGNYLNRIELGGANETSLVAGVGYLHDVAVADDGSIFLTDRYSEAIVKTRFDGSYGTYLSLDPSAFIKPRGLVLDPVAGQLYVTSMQVSPNGAIRRIGTDGSNLTDLVTGLENPHDITLDPVAGKLYWTENIYDSGTGGSIRSAELDGTLVSDVLTGLPKTIRGIDVDPGSARIYWTDHGNDEILRADANGSNAAAILAATNPHDIAIDVQTSKLYWTEGISDNLSPTGLIRRSNLDGSGAEDIVTGLPGLIRDLTVVYLPPIFADGFESGDTTGWSASVP